MIRWMLALTCLAVLSQSFAASAHAYDEKLPAAATEKLDLHTLHHVPVYHNGRMMPWQTLGRTMSEQVVGREEPKILLKSELVDHEYDSPEMAEARALIYGGERKMSASEILLSWLVEPEAWEHIPFILCEHDDLRELLKLPTTIDDGGKLRYVSPAQVKAQLEPGTKFFELMESVENKRAEASREGKSANLTPQEERARELGNRYAAYRQLTTSSTGSGFQFGKFLAAATASREAWAGLVDTLKKNPEVSQQLEVQDKLEAIEQARLAIAQQASTGNFDLSEMEPQVIAYRAGADELAEKFAQLKAAQDPPPVWLTTAASYARRMAVQAQEMHIGLYDNGDVIRVVPALNAAALDADRNPEMRAQPWTSLNMLLNGSSEVLAGHSAKLVNDARNAYQEMGHAYQARDEASRAENFAAASANFSESLRQLGESLNSQRETLDITNRDEALLEYTAYPPPGAMTNEVRYNMLDPFKWSWVISLLALLAFAVSFGAVRKPMYFAGMALTAACILWTTYGFSLRVSVTEWAPVTNMYETVVYVPLFAMVLGLWFLTLPLTWEGLKAAWRLSAIPNSWEAPPLNEQQTKLMHPSTWDVFGYGMIALRVAMMAGITWLLFGARLYDGGTTVLYFWPESLGVFTDINKIIVYLVKMSCALGTIWFGPRAAIALVGMIPFVPMTLRDGRMGKAVDEMLDRRWFALAATGVGTFLFLLAWYATSMVSVDGINDDFSPLMPVLRSNFWLTIHVLTIVSSYAAGLLAWGLGVIAMAYYLFGRYSTPRTSNLPAGHAPARASDEPLRVSPRPPAPTATLASYCYKTMQVAVLLLAAGTILGGLWADVSWGRFWGWDPKEVFALVSLLVYLVVLHGRFAGWTGNFGTALGTNIGAWAIIFSWYGVNFVLGVGLHSYGFGAGGQWQVGAFVLVNALFVTAATVRYLWETNRKVELPTSATGTGAPASQGEDVVTAEMR